MENELEFIINEDPKEVLKFTVNDILLKIESSEEGDYTDSYIYHYLSPEQIEQLKQFLNKHF